MSNKNPIIFRFILVTLLLILIPRLQADQKWTVDVEGGLVTAGYNDVQVPNPGGTRFTLTDALDVKAKIYYRLRLGYQLGVRHQLSLLFAPLTLKGSGQLNQDLWFDQTLFSAGDDVDGTYKFNSYRLTYRYLLIKRPNSNCGSDSLLRSGMPKSVWKSQVRRPKPPIWAMSLS